MAPRAVLTSQDPVQFSLSSRMIIGTETFLGGESTGDNTFLHFGDELLVEETFCFLVEGAVDSDDVALA